jgi:hypothetical protein
MGQLVLSSVCGAQLMQLLLLLPALQFEIATAFGAFLDPVADKIM